VVQSFSELYDESLDTAAAGLPWGACVVDLGQRSESSGRGEGGKCLHQPGLLAESSSQRSAKMDKTLEIFFPKDSTSTEVAESAVSRHRVARSTSTFLETADCRNSKEETPDSKALDPQVCMVLDVYHPSGACSSVDVSYELLEPLDLELGGKVEQHFVDYAYSPIVKKSEDPIQIQSDDDFRVEEAANSGWWQWWLPWKMVRDAGRKNQRLKYRFQEAAFAGGSHGEVWRGRRRKCSYEGCDEPLIFKRLKIEAGYRTLEAGLREVYFGSLLNSFAVQQDPQTRLFTEYVEHFFGENGELWIVFRDAGPSLRSFLYTGTDTGDYVVYSHSWLWTLVRMSLANKADSSAMVLMDSKDENQDTNSSTMGRQLMGSFLRQVGFIVRSEFAKSLV